MHCSCSVDAVQAVNALLLPLRDAESHPKTSAAASRPLHVASPAAGADAGQALSSPGHIAPDELAAAGPGGPAVECRGHTDDVSPASALIPTDDGAALWDNYLKTSVPNPSCGQGLFTCLVDAGASQPLAALEADPQQGNALTDKLRTGSGASVKGLPCAGHPSTSSPVSLTILQRRIYHAQAAVFVAVQHAATATSN